MIVGGFVMDVAEGRPFACGAFIMFDHTTPLGASGVRMYRDTLNRRSTAPGLGRACPRVVVYHDPVLQPPDV